MVREIARRCQPPLQESAVSVVRRQLGVGGKGAFCHQPAPGDDAEQAQEIDGAGSHGALIGRVGLYRPVGGLGESVDGMAEPRPDNGDIAVRGGRQLPVQAARRLPDGAYDLCDSTGMS